MSKKWRRVVPPSSISWRTALLELGDAGQRACCQCSCRCTGTLEPNCSSSTESADATVQVAANSEASRYSASTTEAVPAMAVVSHSSHILRRYHLHYRDTQGEVLRVSDARAMFRVVTAGLVRAVFLPLHVRPHSILPRVGELGRPPHTRGGQHIGSGVEAPPHSLPGESPPSCQDAAHATFELRLHCDTPEACRAGTVSDYTQVVTHDARGPRFSVDMFQQGECGATAKGLCHLRASIPRDSHLCASDAAGRTTVHIVSP